MEMFSVFCFILSVLAFAFGVIVIFTGVGEKGEQCPDEAVTALFGFGAVLLIMAAAAC